MHPDALIASIAEGQFGVVAAAQLHAAGLTARQIRHRVDRGQLERRPGSVLIIRGGAACFEREVVGACLGLGADAAVTREAIEMRNRA